MPTVAIVAIVAMFLAYLAISPSADLLRSSGPAEVILYIDPPPITMPLGLTLPDRNPLR